MGQIVQLLATLIHEPDLIILDELFSGLDPINCNTMRDAVLELKRDGKMVIFSTHIMEQAEQICDRVILINKGKKVLDGTFDEVRQGERQAVWLEYESDGTVLEQVTGVAQVTDRGNHAELFLADGTDAQQVLSDLASKVRIRRFDLRAPSLHEVFIRTVGGETWPMTCRVFSPPLNGSFGEMVRSRSY